MDSASEEPSMEALDIHIGNQIIYDHLQATVTAGKGIAQQTGHKRSRIRDLKRKQHRSHDNKNRASRGKTEVQRNISKNTTSAAAAHSRDTS